MSESMYHNGEPQIIILHELLVFLENILCTCTEYSLALTFNDKTKQGVYTHHMYSIAIELSGDAYKGLKSRKELASHVLTRALLEAVVDLKNIIKNPEYISIRFHKALEERKKKLLYLLKHEPGIITAVGQNEEYVKSYIEKIDNLHDPNVHQPNIRERFNDAGMGDYYDTAYSLLCDYAHHDFSAVINRNLSLYEGSLNDLSILMLSDLIAKLLLDATMAVHESHGSNKIEALRALKLRWEIGYSKLSNSVIPFIQLDARSQ